MTSTPETPLRKQLADLFLRYRAELGNELGAELEEIIMGAFHMGATEARRVPTSVGDVVQLDPEGGCDWGPLFAIVDKVYSDGGIRCDFFVPAENRGEMPGVAPLRVAPGKFARIGVSEWRVMTELDRADT